MTGVAIEGVDQNALNDIVFWGTTAGAAAFTPVPGPIRITVIRHLMVCSMLEHANMTQDFKNDGKNEFKKLNALSRGAPMTRFEMAKAAAYYGCCCCVVEQCFKKLCFIFTVKEAVEDSTLLLHEGWLLAYAMKKGYITNETVKDKNELWRIREAILFASDQIDTSPISKALGSVVGAATGRDIMKESAQSMVQTMSVQRIQDPEEALHSALEATEADQRQELNGMTKKVAEVLRAQRPYLTKFEKIFEGKLEELQQAGMKPSSSFLCC